MAPCCCFFERRCCADHRGWFSYSGGLHFR